MKTIGLLFVIGNNVLEKRSMTNDEDTVSDTDPLCDAAVNCELSVEFNSLVENVYVNALPSFEPLKDPSEKPEYVKVPCTVERLMVKEFIWNDDIFTTSSKKKVISVADGY